jgi:hypothetical protein
MWFACENYKYVLLTMRPSYEPAHINTELFTFLELRSIVNNHSNQIPSKSFQSPHTGIKQTYTANLPSCNGPSYTQTVPNLREMSVLQLSHKSILCMSALFPSLTIHHTLHRKHISQKLTSNTMMFYRKDTFNKYCTYGRAYITWKLKFTCSSLQAATFVIVSTVDTTKWNSHATADKLCLAPYYLLSLHQWRYTYNTVPSILQGHVYHQLWHTTQKYCFLHAKISTTIHFSRF